LVLILDQGFEEIAACPGLLARGRAIINANTEAAQRDALLRDLLRSWTILLDLKQQLLVIASGNTSPPSPLAGLGCTIFVPKIVYISLGKPWSSFGLYEQLKIVIHPQTHPCFLGQGVLRVVLSGSAAQATFGEDILEHLSLGRLFSLQSPSMK
jgi:hypothetical protein